MFKRFKFIPCSIAVLVLAQNIAAKPYIPNDLNAVVLKRTYPVFSASDTDLAKQHKSPKALINQADRFVTYGLEEEDPRFLEYAKNLLAPWWETENAPIRVKILRASINQQAHQFDLAIADLSDILNVHPRLENALSQRANAYRIVGNFEASAIDCRKLSLSSILRSVNCLAQIKNTTSDPIQTANKLERLLAVELSRNEALPDSLEMDVHITLAELYHSAGHQDKAEHYYLKALAMKPQSTYLVLQVAQLLWQENKWQQVLDVIPSSLNNTLALLLRSSASRSLALPEAEHLIQELNIRFEHLRQRDASDASKDLAWFYYTIEPNSKLALRYALQNWALQKETSDAILLYQTALFAHDQRALAALPNWFTSSNLLKTLGSGPLDE